MLADVACGAEPGNRRATRVGRRDPPDLLVVPVHHPRALERPPSKSFDSNFNRGADRTFGWEHLEGLAHIDPALGKGHAVFREEHLVNAAIVFGNPEGDRYPAIGSPPAPVPGPWLNWRIASHESGNTPRPPILRSPFPRPNRSFDWAEVLQRSLRPQRLRRALRSGIRECELLQCCRGGLRRRQVAGGSRRGDRLRDVAPARDRVHQREQCDEETRGPYSTIVTCESSTTKGLNSPVRPCLSVAVTV